MAVFQTVKARRSRRADGAPPQQEGAHVPSWHSGKPAKRIKDGEGYADGKINACEAGCWDRGRDIEKRKGATNGEGGNKKEKACLRQQINVLGSNFDFFLLYL